MTTKEKQRAASRKRRANPDYYRKELERNRLALAKKRATDPAQRERDKAYRNSPKGRVQVALSVSRHAAIKRGHMACTATVDYLLTTLTTECGMCGVEESECRTRLCLDHDHQTGEFRGWLCDYCNKALGYYEQVKSQAEIYLAGL